MSEKQKCHGCGIEKDPTVLEIYPYPDSEESITDEPTDPFLEIDVQPERTENDFGKIAYSEWKKCTVCHECFHKLCPDLWISQEGWEYIQPVVAFQDLPDLYDPITNKRVK